MPDVPNNSPCGACFSAGAKVVEEAFADNLAAFVRYAILSRQGKAPALCQEGGGTYYVCHLATAEEGRHDEQRPRR